MSAPALTLLVRPLCAPSEAQPHAFAGPRVTIGRDRRCDLPLVNAHRAVSRRHAEIRRAEGHFLLIDLGSKNATLLNGRRLLPHRPHLLRAGDHVRIGDFEVEVVLPEALGPAAPAAPLATVYAEPLTAGLADASLRRAVEDLVALSELAFEIGAAPTVHAVTDAVVRRAVQAVGAEHGALALFEPDDPSAVRTLIRLGPAPAAFPSDRRLVPWMQANLRPLRLNGKPQPEAPALTLDASVRSLLCVPLVVRGRLVGLLTLHNKQGAASFSEADERLLAVMATHSAQVIENARLHEEERKLIRVHEELAAAERIQASLLPTAPPAVPGYDLAGATHPAAAVGGDYFDFIELDGERFGVALGDASGKGLPAALLMVRLQAVLRGLARNVASVRACVEQANTLLRERAVRGTFVTLCCGVLSAASHRFRYVNAGHHRPLLLREGGRVETLRSTGPLLGALADFRCEEDLVTLQPGDVLLLYSDGVSEARSEAGEEFGTARLAEVLCRHAALPAADLIEQIFEAVDRHTGGTPPADDMTLLAVRRT